MVSSTDVSKHCIVVQPDWQKKWQKYSKNRWKWVFPVLLVHNGYFDKLSDRSVWDGENRIVTSQTSVTCKSTCNLFETSRPAALTDSTEQFIMWNQQHTLTHWNSQKKMQYLLFEAQSYKTQVRVFTNNVRRHLERKSKALKKMCLCFEQKGQETKVLWLAGGRDVGMCYKVSKYVMIKALLSENK